MQTAGIASLATELKQSMSVKWPSIPADTDIFNVLVGCTPRTGGKNFE